MGFWKTLLGIGEIAGGVVTGQPGLIATGAGTVAAGAQGDAVKQANRQQQAATNKAQGTLDQVYQQTRQDYAPYQNIGSASLSTLNTLMGLPSSPVAGASRSNFAVRDGEIGRMAQRNPNDPNNQTFVNETKYTGDVAIPRGSLATLAAPAQTQSSFVTVMSPDGRTGQIPAALVDQAIARGGRVVGGVS